MSFFSRIKKLASETAIYGISSILGRMINFLLFPFYSNVFPPDRYGVVTVVYAAFVFLNIVYQYGMESAYMKYASDTRSAEARSETFSASMWSLLGTSVVFSTAMVVFQEPVGQLIGLEANWLGLLYYAALILVLDTLTIVPFAELRLQNRPWRFAMVRFASILVNVGLNLVLILGAGMGIEAVFLANVAASATMLLLLLPTMLHQWRLSFDGGLWKELMRFGLPFVPGGLGYALTERVNIFYLSNLSRDRVLALYGDAIDTARLQERASEAALKVLDGAMPPDGGGVALPDVPLPFALPELPAPGPAVIVEPEVLQQMVDAANAVYGQYVVGIFGGVIKLAIFMTLVVQMFRYAWQPFFLQHAEDEDARSLFARVFTLFTAVGLLVFLGISFFARELVALPLPGGRHLVAEPYWLGLFIVPVALIGYLFQGWYYNFAAGAYIEKKTSYFIHCTLAGSAVALTLNITLVPRYGMLAAAWATTLSYAVMALMLFLLVRRFYVVPYEWGRVLAAGALAVGLFLAWDFVPALRHWWVELPMIGVFLAGLLGLRIVPPSTLRRLARRARSSLPGQG